MLKINNKIKSPVEIINNYIVKNYTVGECFKEEIIYNGNIELAYFNVKYKGFNIIVEYNIDEDNVIIDYYTETGWNRDIINIKNIKE